MMMLKKSRTTQRALLHAACVALAVLAAMPATAQVGMITGTVKDERGRTVPGANVILQGTALGAAADVRGVFAIRNVPAGSHVVAASAVGFRSARTEITVEEGETVSLDLVLQEITVQSGEVVVTASRREQAALSTAVSLSFITPRDLERRNVLVLDEALRQVPGIQMVDNQVNIRGSSGFAYGVGSRVLVLVDGVPMLGPDQGDIKYDAFPVSQVERIEIIKGPGSALYGGNALGGVINLITRDFPDVPETQVKLHGGAFEPVRYEEWRENWDEADDFRMMGGTVVTHARRIGDRLGFWANVAFSGTQGYLQENTQRNIQTYAKVGFRPSPETSLYVFGGFSQTRREIFLFWNSARDPLRLRRTEFITGGNRGYSEQLSVLPVFRHLVNPRLFYTVKGRFFGIAFKPADFRWRIRPEHSHTYGERFGGEVQVNYQASMRTYITGGITGDWNQARSDFFRGEDMKLQRFQPEGAAFLQVEYEPLYRLTLVGGLRLDGYRIDAEETAARVSPKLNAAYQLSDLVAVRASFGRGFRVPSPAERFVNNREFLPLEPNPLLRPEESTGYEAGIRGIMPLGQNWGARWDVAGFWTDYHQLVEPQFVQTLSAFQFLNLTRARIRGVEASVDLAERNEAVLLNAGYTFLDPRDLSEDQPLIFRSRHLLHLSGTYAPVAPVELGFDFRFSSKPERFDTDFGTFVRDSELMVPVRVLDLRAGTSWRMPGTNARMRTSLHVKNALEYYYVERPALLAPPRHFTLQLIADF